MSTGTVAQQLLDQHEAARQGSPTGWSYGLLLAGLSADRLAFEDAFHYLLAVRGRLHR